MRARTLTTAVIAATLILTPAVAYGAPQADPPKAGQCKEGFFLATIAGSTSCQPNPRVVVTPAPEPAPVVPAPEPAPVAPPAPAPAPAPVVPAPAPVVPAPPAPQPPTNNPAPAPVTPAPAIPAPVTPAAPTPPRVLTPACVYSSAAWICYGVTVPPRLVFRGAIAV